MGKVKGEGKAPVTYGGEVVVDTNNLGKQRRENKFMRMGER